MSRVINFSAGPAALPVEVLEQAKAELPDWQGSGMSVMEISHRSKAFLAVAEQAEADLRELLAISDDYAVLFLQGGATMQFALLPLNLSQPGDTVDYLLTGSWSKKAAREAGVLRNVNIVADGADSSFTDVPAADTWKLDSSAAYFHYTPNETIGGVEISEPPNTGSVPIIADMSSTILSRSIDVNRFGAIYAGAQKNIGPAGLTIVIMRRDLLDRVSADVPNIMRYKSHADGGSMLNTPPTFAWYLAGLVFKWVKARGGVAAMAEQNQAKADLLYGAIDASPFYANPVAKAYRSWMNVPFTLAKPELDAEFLAQAEAAGLTNLKGHRSVGGMRASIYNAMPVDGVQALVDFMAAFESENA
ncbi:MAG: 3-phosphoserine/phosphohydroxythreonine transaminase [Gammaproteobacteria bacterium]|nr:3-phosphoserine/phosphohydroxythreonine transaminase [Gammaproteobacteria bacterium]